MAPKPRRTGIDELGDQPWGTHFCLFYESKEDLLDLLIPFLETGLADHEYCLYVASGPLGVEAAEQAIRQAIPDVERYQSEGQIEIIAYQTWYFASGNFDPRRVRQSWIDKLEQALARGYAGMRFTSNAFWLEKKDWQTFAEYEAQMEEAFRELRVLAVCAYGVEQASAADMLDVVKHHQFTVARRHGAWERLEGSELARAQAEIRRLNADLERKVEDRTAQLAAVNQQLTGEVAERRRSEEALRASEARLNAAIEAADIGLWDWDLVSGRVTWLGHQQELFGFAPGEFDGTDRGLAKHVHPDDLVELNRVAQRARDSGSVFAHEYRVIWHDGSIHWIAARGRFLFNATGQPMRMYGALRNISERKQTEAALRQSAAELSEAQQVAHLGNWSLDIATNAVHWSAELYRIFDVEPQAFDRLYESFLSRVHPDDRARVAQVNAEVRESGQPFEVEYRITTRSGLLKHIREIGYARRDSAGGVSGLFGTAQEITERKQAEEALRRSEADYRALADNSVQGITIYQDHKIIYTNPAVSRILGYTAEDFKSMSIEQIIALTHPFDRPIAEERAQKRMAGEALPPSIEVRILRKDGSMGWVQAFIDPIEYHGRPAVISTMIDITERKQAEAETERQAARAATLARIAARLNKNLELEAVIQAVSEEAVNTFNVSQATMSLYDKKRDQLIYAGGVNIPPEYGATIEPITRARFQELIQGLGPIMVVPDIQAVPNVPNAEFSSRLDVRTVVTVAMLRDEELIGVLAVGVNGHAREFANDELTLLKAVSDLAAQAIANAQLLKGANEQHEQLRALSAKLAEAQEAERRAIARELHDEIGQMLYAVGANLEVIKLSSDTVTLAGRLADSAALVDEAIRQVRDLALELRPSMLDDFGLLPALAWLVERQAQRAGYQVDFTAEPRDLRLPASLDTAVYRVVQIALTNVARHAQARHATVTVRRQGPQLELLVQDDGVGFDVVAALERAQQGATLGLASMQERVRLAGGTLEINSAPGQGATIRACFPIEPPGRP